MGGPGLSRLSCQMNSRNAPLIETGKSSAFSLYSSLPTALSENYTFKKKFSWIGKENPTISLTAAGRARRVITTMKQLEQLTDLSFTLVGC